MTGDTRSLQPIADSLAGTFPGRDDAPLALGLLRELARGEQVAATALGAAAGRDEADVADVAAALDPGRTCNSTSTAASPRSAG